MLSILKIFKIKLRTEKFVLRKIHLINFTIDLTETCVFHQFLAILKYFNLFSSCLCSTSNQVILIFSSKNGSLFCINLGVHSGKDS